MPLVSTLATVGRLFTFGLLVPTRVAQPFLGATAVVDRARAPDSECCLLLSLGLQGPS